MGNARILLVEDDRDACRLLERYLTLKGFDVEAAFDGDQAVRAFVLNQPDLVVLDINMPKMDGWSVLEEIRSFSDVPVIMVTVHDGTEDKVRGLHGGADDYVTKPFDLKEIEARIHAVLRRSRDRSTTNDRAPAQKEPPTGGVAVVRAGPLIIDDRTKEVRLYGRSVSLSPKEYQLLMFLAKEPGRVRSTDEIIGAVWPERFGEATPEDVKKYVYLLRSKLGDRHSSSPLIQTVRGFGYRLDPEATEPPAM